MSQDFNKELEAYTSNNNPVRGKYHFDIPHDIEPACYNMHIDYESHDELNPDAYQYDGYIVVGHTPHIKASPIIIPYNTSATSEEAITLYEKRNTNFSVVMEAFKNADFSGAIKQLPIYMRVAKGLFRDYYENENTAYTTICNDYESASQSSTLTLPLTTNNNGKINQNVKVSDIYDIEETINDVNTLFFRCRGTRDRGTDNYVPMTVEVPLIIGTTEVYLQTTCDLQKFDSNPSTYELPSLPYWGLPVCGKGDIEISYDLLYKFAMRNDTTNNKMKYHYEDYRTDSDKRVKVGSCVLQYKDDNDNWITVPGSQLSAGDNYTTVQSDGTIIQRANHENGSFNVVWSNEFQYSTKKLVYCRIKYNGVTGATFSQYSTWFALLFDPSFGEPNAYETRVVMNQQTFEGTPGTNIQVCGKLQQKSGNNWVDATEGQGTVTVRFSDNSTQTANVSSNGSFCVTVNKAEGGTYPVTISFHDANGLYSDASVSSTIEIASKTTTFDITTPVTLERNAQGNITGKIMLVENGNNVNMSNGRGTVTVTGDLTTTASVSSNGSFSLTFPGHTCGTYTLNLSYHDDTQRFDDCTKTIVINVPYTTVIELDDDSLVIKNGDTYSLTGRVVKKDGSTDAGTVAGGTLVNSLNNANIQIAQNGTFTVSGTVNHDNTFSGTLTYQSTATTKSSNKGFTIQSKAFDVTITRNSGGNYPGYIAYDLSTSTDDQVVLTLKDEYNNPVTKGQLKVYLHPDYYAYSGNIDPIEVKTITVPSNGVITKDAGEFITSALTNAFNEKGWYLFLRYKLSVAYTDSTNAYNDTNTITSTNQTYLTYQVVNPKIHMKVEAKSPSSSSYGTPLIAGFITDFASGNGDISPTSAYNVPANADILITFRVVDSNGNVIQGIRQHNWVTNEHDLTIYHMDQDNNITTTPVDPSIMRTVPVEHVEIDEDTGKETIYYTYEPTTIPINPNYAGIPIYDPQLYYEQSSPGKTSNTSGGDTIYFRIPANAHDTTTFFLGLSKYAYAIFGRYFNSEVCYYDSYHDGLTGSWYTTPTNHEYGVVMKIDFETP